MADKQPEFTTTGKPHPFHLVDPSIWPLISSFAAGFLAFMAVLYMHEKPVFGMDIGLWGVYTGFAAVIFCMIMWWKDILYEAVVQKAHSVIAQIGLRYGMMLFIVSEVMFFVAFFWAYFNAALWPVGGHWPPEGIIPVGAFGLPFMMTMILLLSGCAVTWAHHAVLHGDQEGLRKGLGYAVILGTVFLCFQVYEYSHLLFGFTDGIFPSTFYMATGFHGFHVLVGTIFLAVCYFRACKGHFTAKSHFGFEAAAWYWHFVDVVWLFLFIAVYWWGGMGYEGPAGH